MPSTFSQVRAIDNTRRQTPLITLVLIALIIAIAIWFLRGGSFRLYASAFFGLYFLTRRVWISVLLIGILQNLIFLPLRFIGLKLSTSLKQFEDELEETKNEGQQYFLFTQKVRRGDPAIIFFIFNFVVNAIAFFSAGRIFLIDFYTQRLNPDYLYHFIPYPQYPLQGTNFYFPFFKITDTIAVPWSKIFLFWLIISLAFAVPKFLWRFIKPLLWRNQQILSARINYNRLLLITGGFSGTIFVLSLIFLRHIPTAFQGWLLAADLTRQNTTMNFITAIGTFITTLHAGYTHGSLVAAEGRRNNIPENIILRVFRAHMRQSFKNALILGAGAFLVTNHIPCAFELSVATFEVLYILSPYTFNRLLPKGPTPTPAPVETPQTPPVA
ncbi:hypothetical protein A3K55_00820 [Candidatus Shapirobacteria bacterium RBG_13_44_7]|uniref:Uncharacterized protein n=1 Tax=Candidatus Shapirobacteria bacterium RBG_13_44_7 TaxID=1802149 RepID=A0A1F7SKS2_9BACT|nr:MAG: hypothetical protein A3K55_00820 [Candidatus Shapirobacteria bacterium RBG_13_44_7]